MTHTPISPTPRKDWTSALSAYLIWGLFPLYWHLFIGIPAFEIVLQRSIFSALILAGVIAFVRRENLLRQIREAWGSRNVLVPSSLLIGANWLIYVWAVNSGQVLEASLGYFICPFIQIVFGAVFHGERLSKSVLAAILVSFSGVAWIALASGLHSFPWVSLVIATTFAAYGSIKKPRNGSAGVPPIQGAFFEALFLAVPALLYVAYHATSAPPAFYSDSRFWILSFFGGGLTALPLILYSTAAKRLPLSALGFFQFINPTIQFALAITVFGETLQPEKGVGFALIWAGVAVFLSTKLRGLRVPRKSTSVKIAA